MKTTASARRVLGRATLVALLLPLGGCGGGGGSSAPAADTSLPSACSTTAYLPNYATGDGSGMTFTRWRSFPVHVYLDKSSSDYTDDRAARFVTAMDSWVTQVGGNRVSYILESSAASADIVVGFIPTTDSMLTSRDAVGITFTEETSGSVSGRRTLATANVYIGIDGSLTRENGTMAHEFGHALGIGGHSPNPIDLMYRSGGPNRSPIPTTSDVNTLTTAYCNDFISTATADSTARHVPVPANQRSGIWHVIP